MEFGDAAEMAVTVAREKGADAIVIGKRGLSGVEEFLPVSYTHLGEPLKRQRIWL